MPFDEMYPMHSKIVFSIPPADAGFNPYACLYARFSANSLLCLERVAKLQRESGVLSRVMIGIGMIEFEDANGASMTLPLWSVSADSTSHSIP
jgi:hypothetical protein